jgi:hypothetical protein
MRRPLVRTIALLALPGTIKSVFEAFRRFHAPSPAWFAGFDQWYDHIIAAVLGATVLTACIVYDWRKTLAERGAANEEDPIPVPPQRWRDMRELRCVLYVYAAAFVFALPIAIYKDFMALKDNPPAFRSTFWSLYPFEGIIYPPIGVALIVYDRQRLEREAREDTGRCAVCGYDLRATPQRCPECGAIPPAAKGAAA